MEEREARSKKHEHLPTFWAFWRFHERLSASVASRSHYFHAKVHRGGRDITGPAAPWHERYESGDSKAGSLRQPLMEMQKGRSIAAAAFPLLIGHSGEARSGGPRLWSTPALRPASVPQKTKASPSLSQRQAREPARLPGPPASGRELPSPSSVPLSSQPS